TRGNVICLLGVLRATPCSWPAHEPRTGEYQAMAQSSAVGDGSGRVRLDRKPNKPELKKWTDLGLRKLKPPKGKQQWSFWDLEQKGLELLVSPSGTKTFRSRYKLSGKWEARSIGRLGENATDRDGDNWSVAAAREQCRMDRA